MTLSDLILLRRISKAEPLESADIGADEHSSETIKHTPLAFGDVGAPFLLDDNNPQTIIMSHRRMAMTAIMTARKVLHGVRFNMLLTMPRRGKRFLSEAERIQRELDFRGRMIPACRRIMSPCKITWENHR